MTAIALDRIVDLLPMYRDLLWGLNAQPHFITSNIDDGDDHVVADHNALIALPR